MILMEMKVLVQLIALNRSNPGSDLVNDPGLEEEDKGDLFEVRYPGFFGLQTFE